MLNEITLMKQQQAEKKKKRETAKWLKMKRLKL